MTTVKSWYERLQRLQKRQRETNRVVLNWEMGFDGDPPTEEQLRLVRPQISMDDSGSSTPIASHQFCIYDSGDAHRAFG